MTVRALALDLGGSHASCAVMEETRCLAREECALEAGSLRETLPKLEQLLRRAVVASGVAIEACDGLVLGFPGVVDGKAGRVISTNAKYDDALALDLPGWVEQRFGLRLALENDARLALMGEHFCGGAAGAEDAVLVTLGTGIGVSAMLGGNPLRGRYPQAGCLGGHLPAVLGGRRCTCGGVGCAEAEASTWALEGICREWPGFAESALASGRPLNFASVFAASDVGDAVAKAVVERCLAVWSALAVGLVHAYSPELLLFGGGVMARKEAILPVIEAHIRRHTWSPPGYETRVGAAVLGADAALYGAVPLLKETR